MRQVLKKSILCLLEYMEVANREDLHHRQEGLEGHLG